MTWPPDDALPQAAETGLGALLMQFEPPDDIYMMIKTVGTSTGSITETTVNGEPAWWIEGASNLTIFGQESVESRSTANVLLWQQSGIGFRLESGAFHGRGARHRGIARTGLVTAACQARSGIAGQGGQVCLPELCAQVVPFSWNLKASAGV
ncbi:MAG: hypothetical protein R2848_07325 [Thermomicrobiales bacterium]